MWAAAVCPWIVVCVWGDFPLFSPGWNYVHSSPPRSNYIQPSAHSVYDDVLRGFDARDQAEEGYGRLQMPFGLLCGGVGEDFALFRDGFENLTKRPPPAELNRTKRTPRRR